jgi:hypothetical protein
MVVFGLDPPTFIGITQNPLILRFYVRVMLTPQAQEREEVLLKYATEKSIETTEIPLEEVGN